MLSIFLSFYFSCLLQFSFVSHPIIYCMLLLGSCVSGAGFCYFFSGLSWYIILLCLVYIGGVYILFIFISIHNPNPNSFLGSSLLSFFCLFLFFYYLFSFFDFSSVSYMDNSHYLCSFFEGFSYCSLCLVLLLGFIIISAVSSSKNSFYR